MQDTKYGDKELITLCLEGQERAYALLYERYSVPVFNTICRLVNQQINEAEDLLQETFVAVFSNMERLKNVESFEGWTKRVAINLSITHLRKRRIYFEEIMDQQLAQDTEEEEYAAWKENKLEEIEQAIEELPETARTIVNLYLFEDLPQEEIARLLGMTHTAVRSQYHRAKNRIASKLKKEINHE